MMNTQMLREQILAARESRAALRRTCAASGQASVSLSLNIPGSPKSSPALTAFFQCVLSELHRFLLARRVLVDPIIEQCDAAGDFYLAALRSGHAISDIKAFGEEFETRHPVGRIIDVDVTDEQGQPVSSQKLKPCLLCEQPALVCMREQSHSYRELREALTTRITAYMAQRKQTRICKQLACMAVKAALYEITVSPKPGLVDRFDQGAHQDMDYFTFLDSSAALAGYFEELAVSGAAFAAADLTQALPLIREIGLKMEAAMFRETGGVNTQKGLIFLSGLALFAASYTIAKHERFAVETCREVIAAICRDIVRRELGVAGDTSVSRVEFSENSPTHGETCFRQYGSVCGGVRQEAEAGFPSVFEHGLPELRRQLAPASRRVSASEMNAALIRTLLRLMTVVNDTNIIYRQNLRTLQTLQNQARAVLQAEQPDEEQARYADLIAYCRDNNVSPGGSADLLAVTIFFYFAESAFSSDVYCHEVLT